MLLKSIKLNNFLSFGPSSEAIDMRPLNIIIGPNGSGKSNLLEAIELIRRTPIDVSKAILDGGGIRDWIWKGAVGSTTASIEAIFANPKNPINIRYLIKFREISQRFELVDERIESEAPYGTQHQPYIFYKYDNGYGVINVNGNTRKLQQEEVDPSSSILSQRKDPVFYPELTYLGSVFSKFKLYREWTFGRYTAPRLAQKTDLPNEFLDSDASNLGLVLSKLRRDPAVKKQLLECLQALYAGIDDYDVQIEGGTVQVFFQEGKFIVPATRLSDGTLRYLCLLAILCHPEPPPLICIEEPELGLHPDILPKLAELLIEASQRTQIIVTTHSDVLIDAMSDFPENVLIADKTENGTSLTRLKAQTLKPWLEKYRLGQLWTRGDIGGTRW